VKARRAGGRARDRAQFLKCGKSNPRAFVCKRMGGRSTELQVYSMTGGDQEPLTIRNLKGVNGEALLSTAGMIHMADSTMLMIDQKTDQVHQLDLATEKVVRTYNADEEKVENIFPVSKFAQQTGEQTFLAMNSKAAFVMDPRKGDMAKARGYAYSGKPQLACMASDSQGHFVLGSRLGEFRLFDGEANKDGHLKRAKTMLQGLGDPVTHVDVTADGSWILGTCANYLVLLDTSLMGGANAFTKSMPADMRPKPIKLCLKPEDLAKNGLSNAEFTAARFDANDRGKADQRIITSIGSVAVVWDFTKVKRGKTSAYNLKKTDDYIVATDILATDKRVVVAYDDGLHTLAPR
jgi:hypothetical protein